ncbi:MAG: hypothetical protein J6C86_07475 [Bacteroidaceae bacterium]|nr:hypothetical protein [Bacteroidaceae bacterium]
MKAIIDAQSFKNAIEKTKKFVSKNSYNLLMKYIHIVVDAKSQEVLFEALDGHRFSRAYTKLLQADESFECFIGTNIPKIERHDISAEIECDGDRVLVTVGDGIMGYRQPEGKFFDLEKIANPETEPVVKLGVNGKLMAEALNSVKDLTTTCNLSRLYIYGPKDPVFIRSNEKDVAGVLPLNVNWDRYESGGIN